MLYLLEEASGWVPRPRVRRLVARSVISSSIVHVRAPSVHGYIFEVEVSSVLCVEGLGARPNDALCSLSAEAWPTDTYGRFCLATLSSLSQGSCEVHGAGSGKRALQRPGRRQLEQVHARSRERVVLTVLRCSQSGAVVAMSLWNMIRGCGGDSSRYAWGLF